MGGKKTKRKQRKSQRACKTWINYIKKEGERVAGMGMKNTRTIMGELEIFFWGWEDSETNFGSRGLAAAEDILLGSKSVGRGRERGGGRERELCVWVVRRGVLWLKQKEGQWCFTKKKRSHMRRGPAKTAAPPCFSCWSYSQKAATALKDYINIWLVSLHSFKIHSVSSITHINNIHACHTTLIDWLIHAMHSAYPLAKTQRKRLYMQL